MKKIVTKLKNGSILTTFPAPAMFDVNSYDRVSLAAKGILVNASDSEVLEWIRKKDAPNGLITD